MANALQHIMCIDDEEDILEIIRLCLEDLGQLKASCFTDVERALSAATSLKPDLILLDVMMPRINGPEAIHMFRQQQATAKTPIVLMTARVQPNEIVEYKLNGANGVIAKPFDPITLLPSINEIWNSLHADN